MRALLIALLLTGCSGNWQNHQYGPGDWLNDNTPLSVTTMHNYERFIDPEITVVYYEHVVPCLSKVACARLSADMSECTIHAGVRVSPSVMAHEKRHCHGWTHPSPDYRAKMMYTDEEWARQLERAKMWRPMARYQ